MSTAKPKRDIRFVYKTEYRRDSISNYTTFRADVVYMDEPDYKWNPNDAGVRNPQANSWGEDDLSALASLSITAQFANDRPESGWYGFAVEYRDAYAIDLRQAERMVKLLRKLDKGLAKLDEQFGRTDDLAAFCGRVARVLGATSSRPFGHYSKEVGFSGTHYTWHDVDSLRHRLDDAAKEHAVTTT